MTFDPRDVSAWADVGIKLAACFGLAWSIWFFCKGVFVRIIQSVRHSDVMHAKFGPDPASRVHDLIDELRVCSGNSSIISELMAKESDMAIYFCDSTGKCTKANSALCKMFRLSESQMLDYGWMQVISQDEAEHVYQQWSSSIKDSRPYRASYVVHGIKRVTEAWPMKLDGGVRSYIGYVTDEKP